MDKNQNNEYERTISLTDLWAVFSKCWIFMIIAGVVVGGLFFTRAYVTYEEQYTAQSSLVVIRKGSGTTGSYGTGDYSIDLYMVNDVAKLLKTPSFLDMVVKDLQANPDFTGEVSIKSLSRDIKVETFEETRFVCFTNTADTPKNAKIIAQTICRLMKQQIEVNFDVDRVSILDDGYVSNQPSNSPIGLIELALPVVAALMIMGIYLIIYMFDDKIKTPEDVEKYLGLNVLGMIPNIDSAGKVKSRYYSAYYAKYGKYSEYGNSSSEK